MRYLIVNLARMRVVLTVGTYADAVRIANEFERDTRQLHGVERAGGTQ